LTASASSATTDDATGAAPAAAEHLVLEVAGRRWACASADVREVMPALPATRIPGAPHYVRGLVNVRGGVLPVVDLAARLADEEGAPVVRATQAAEPTLVLAHADGRRLALLVDDVHDVRSVTVHDLDGGVGDAARGRIVRGVGRMGDEVVGVIDVAALVRETLV
jgi:purine-binding chemotaxis protein CheW